MIIDTEDCWLYAGQKSVDGYGRILIKGKQRAAHRVMWEDANSRVIPEGLEIDHLCRVPPCINPAHLEAVTRRENVLRGISSAAYYSRRKSCKSGHLFTKENTYMRGTGRCCRKCKSIWIAKRRKAEKA